MKLVDNVVPAADLVKTAKEWIKAGGKAVKPWDEQGFKFPGGLVFSKAGMMTFPPANAIYRRETYDNYPAARAIMQTVFEGLQLPIDLALRVESRWFAKILRSPEAHAMIRSLFVSMQDLNKGARRPANVPPTKLKKVGIIGAGLMGAGIAYVSAQGGLDVVLIDRDQEAADKGKAYSHKILTDQINKGRGTSADRDALLAKITATPDYNALKGCDLIVEAVFEDRKVKAEATAKAQAVLPDVVFGSNTSTLPITSLAEQAKDPAKFIGIHFFSPVDKMLLVEIILGKKTGDEALATALDFVRAIRKTPIVVNDSARLLHLARGRHLHSRRPSDADRRRPRGDDRECRRAWPACRSVRSRSTTRSAVDLAWKILKATEADLGAEAIDPRQKALLSDMVEKHGRLGRKNGKGFYDYPEKAPKKLWPGLADLQKKKLDPDTHRCRGTEGAAARRCRRWRPRAASRRACSPMCARRMSAPSSVSASRRSPAARCPIST